jgi:hypothetical protein
MAAKWGKKGKKVNVGGARAGTEDKPARISNKLEHVLVAESKPVPNQRLKATGRRVVHHRRFKPATIAFVAIVVLASVAVYLTRPKEGPVGVPPGPKCSYAVLEKAKPALDVTKVAELEPQAQAIEQIAGYDQDVNCLYVVLTYYINTSDAPKARELYNKLAAAYNPNEGYETVIRDVTKTPEELGPTITFLENQAKQQNFDAAGGMEGVR